MSRLQCGRVQTLGGPQLQLSAVQTFQLGHGAQVGLLQLLQLAVVLLVGEEDLTEVQAVRSISAHQHRVAPPTTLAVAELRARVLVLHLGGGTNIALGLASNELTVMLSCRGV